MKKRKIDNGQLRYFMILFFLKLKAIFQNKIKMLINKSRVKLPLFLLFLIISHFSCDKKTAIVIKQPPVPVKDSLAFQESFDSLNPAIWQMQLYSFVGNGC